MVEEAQEKMHEAEKIIRGLFHSEHPISTKTRELIEMLNEAVIDTPAKKAGVVPSDENLQPLAKKIHKIHDVPENSELVGIDFLFAGDRFYDPCDNVPLTLIPSYAKFMREFVNLNKIYVGEENKDLIGRGVVSISGDNALIPKTSEGKEHALFEGFERFLEVDEKSIFTKVTRTDRPDFGPYSPSKQVPQGKNIETIILRKFGGCNIFQIFGESGLEFGNMVCFEGPYFRENHYTPETRDFVLKALLNVLEKKELLYCQKEGEQGFVVYEDKIVASFPEPIASTLESAPQHYLDSISLALLCTIFRLIYEVDFRRG
jgi:hypothetical protein